MNQHFKQIVSVRFAVGPTAATADNMLQVWSVHEQTTQVSQRLYFGGLNFHIVEFAKYLGA